LTSTPRRATAPGRAAAGLWQTPNFAKLGGTGRDVPDGGNKGVGKQ